MTDGPDVDGGDPGTEGEHSGAIDEHVEDDGRNGADAERDDPGDSDAERVDRDDADDDRARSAVARAVRAAFRSDSLLLRSYAVVAVLVGTFVVLLVTLAFPRWVALTSGGVLDRVARGLLVLVGLAVLAGVLAPLLFVDRRRRAGRSEREFAHALAGYGYLCSLYLALVTSAPPGLRSEPSGVLAPLVDALYALPNVAGFAFVAVGVGLLLGVEYGLDRSRAD